MQFTVNCHAFLVFFIYVSKSLKTLFIMFRWSKGRRPKGPFSHVVTSYVEVLLSYRNIVIFKTMKGEVKGKSYKPCQSDCVVPKPWWYGLLLESRKKCWHGIVFLMAWYLDYLAWYFKP